MIQGNTNTKAPITGVQITGGQITGGQITGGQVTNGQVIDGEVTDVIITDQHTVDPSTKSTAAPVVQPIEKKKRGRPKKVVIESTSPNKTELLKKKRGRQKKADTVNLPLPITIMSSRNESNYLVMLDIKYSDLDSSLISQKDGLPTAQGTMTHTSAHGPIAMSGLAKKESQTLTSDNSICDGLINIFSKLLQDKRDVTEKYPTLQTVHKKLIGPEESGTNFHSNYEQKEIDTKVLPMFGLNGESWPGTSNYACWNCDCQFDTQPIGIPESILSNQFYCSGNFCSFPCAARYILDTDSTVNRFEKISLLTTLYQMAYNLDLNCHVPVANPKQTLHKYGGSLSYDQYHSEKSKELSLYKLPIIPLYYHMCHENLRSAQEQKDNQSEYTREVISFT